jgi:methylated-DNA-protein-cysteine methyltransferase related protein
MPKSPFFIRIKADVLKIVAAIPEGSVCSYASIGEHLDVMPRHVAYILSMLEPYEQIEFPWHRVVGGNGKLGKSKRSAVGQSQAALLLAEGILVENDSIASSLLEHFVPAAKLKSGVRKQARPVAAPAAKIRKIK